MNMEKNKTIQRILAMALSFVLVLTTTPMTAPTAYAQEGGACSHVCGDGTCGYVEGADCTHECGEDCAEDCIHTEHDGECGYIAAMPCKHEHDEDCGGLLTTLEDLNGGTRESATSTGIVVLGFSTSAQALTVPLGTSYGDIPLPETLSATVEGEPDPADIPVEWTDDGGYDGDAPGDYGFTGELGAGYILADDVNPPTLTVTVKANAATSGQIIVARFDALDEDTLWQGYDPGEIASADELNLTATLTGADTDGEALTIEGVTWECTAIVSDPDAETVAFDPNISNRYDFTAVLPEGYEPAEGVSLPVISVFIRGDAVAMEAGSDLIISGGTLDSHYTYALDSTTDTYTLTITENGTYTIGMASAGTTKTTDRIVVLSGLTDVNITLNGVSIDVSGTSGACAFDMIGAAVNLTLEGKNELKSGTYAAGLNVPSGSELTISESSMGSLTATGNFSAGIGGGNRGSGGNVTINGGTVTATGNIGGAGIGGGGNGAGGNVTINGGTVIATGGNQGAGIGGGASGAGGYITINGGTVIAIGGTLGAGIGGGGYDAGENVTINGGTVTAIGKDGGAGIGGGVGSKGAGGNVTINGGTVTATGKDGGAGIGSGVDFNGAGGNLTITGGSVRREGAAALEAQATRGGEKLYPVTLTVGAPAIQNVKVTAGSIGGAVCTAQIPGDGEYGIKDVKTDDDGKLYFYLPVNENVSILMTADGVNYSNNTVTITATGDNAATLTPKLDKLQFLIQPQDTEVIYNYIVGSITALAGGPSDTVISYQWYECAADGAGANPAQGANRNVFTIPTSLEAGTYYYYCEASADGLTTVKSSIAAVRVAAEIPWVEAGDFLVQTVREYNYNTSNGILEISQDGDYTVKLKKGIESTRDSIDILGNGITVNLTLDGVKIDRSSVSGSTAMWVNENNNLNLTLAGENELKSGVSCPGLQAGVNRTIVISADSTGSLTATGGNQGAGIGGGYDGAGGNITINGGTITANGGTYGAGIGSGWGIKTGGNITINGGTVIAKGGGFGAGIGGGYTGTGGNVNIDGGTVIAKGGTNGAGIGGGNDGAGGYVIINGRSVRRDGTAKWEAAAKNGAGKSVYLTTLTVGYPVVINSPITEGKIDNVPCAVTPDAQNSIYGINGVKTDADGKLYFWLPSSTNAPVSITAGGIEYSGRVSPAADDAAEVTLYDAEGSLVADIAEAKTLIENKSFGPVPQAYLNTQAEAKKYVEGIIGDLSLNDVIPTVADVLFTEAIAGTVSNQTGTNGSYTFTVALNKGAETEQTTRELTLTITATPYDPTQDNIDIDEARIAIERSFPATVAQADIADEAAALSKIKEIIGRLPLNGVTSSVTKASYTEAAAGTESSQTGTNGSYTFTVTLNKGAGMEETTKELTLTITATAYVPPPTYHPNDIAIINGIIENNGLSLTEWENGDMPPSNWEGVVSWSGEETLYHVTKIFADNKGLTGALDVRGLTNLQTLSCYDNNLTTLDVSGLSSLKELGCSNNSLAELDLTGLSELQTLSCYNNNLATLDLSGNVALSWIFAHKNPLDADTLEALKSRSNIVELTYTENLCHYSVMNHISVVDYKVRTISVKSEGDICVLGDIGEVASGITVYFRPDIDGTDVLAKYLGYSDAIGLKDIDTETLTAVPAAEVMSATLYFKGDYPITYELDGGTLQDTPAASYTYGGSLTLPTPEKSGYIFDGWYSNAEFTGEAVTALTSADYGSKVFWAKWSPPGEITVKAREFTSFLNAITFGLFFKDTQYVTITATDSSEAVTIKYILSETSITKTELEKKPDVDWTTYSAFDITPGKYFIYAKLTDTSGNSEIISTDGIVIYTDSEQNTASIGFTKGSGADQTADVTLNGNTINKIMNGADTLTANTHYTISSGTITFKATYLESLTAGSYTLTVHYNPHGVEYPASPSTDSEAPATTVITLTVTDTPPTAIRIQAIDGITPPATGDIPTQTITDTTEYTAAISWLPNDNPFQANKIYTATITITPKSGYTLTGVVQNFFAVAGATSVTNDANSGTVTAVFPQTVAGIVDLGAQTISITAPVTSQSAQDTITAGTGYTGAISWTNETDGGTAHSGTFAASKVYKATVVLTSTTGYQWPTTAPTITVDGQTVANTNVSGTGTGNTLAFDVTFAATAYDPTNDNTAITTAVGLIEANAPATVAQATVNTEVAVKTWLAEQLKGISGMSATGIVIAEADITISDFSAAKAGTVGNTSGTNGSFSFVVNVKKGAGTSTDTTTKIVTITATAYDPTGDNNAISTARGLIESNAPASVTQATANTEEAAKTWLVEQLNCISGMSVTGITVAKADITISGFSAAKAGTVGNTSGTNGSFSFVVNVKKGAGTSTDTTTKSVIITATAYDPTGDNTAISTAIGLIESNAPTNVAQATVNTEAAAKTWLAEQLNGISGMSATEITVAEADITISGFSAAKAGTVGNTSGTNGSFSFVVNVKKGAGTPADTASKIVTITATAYDPTGDNNAISTAKGLIEASATTTVAQATANTEEAVKTWLVAQLNAIAGMSATGIVIAEGDITISDFSAATAGTVGNTSGKSGSFSFVVNVKKSAGTPQTTATLTLTITATAYNNPAPYTVTVNNGTGGGSYEENATVTITANTAPAGQQFKEWTITSSVTFTDGTDATSVTVKFIMPAQAVTVTATYEAIPPTVTGVMVNPSTKTLTSGDTFQFSAKVSGTNNPPQTVTWSVYGGNGSSTIAQDGTLSVHSTEANGANLTVTVTSTYNTGVSGTVMVTVYQAPAFVPVTSITGVPTTATVGIPLNLTGTVAPSNATNNTITWNVQSAGTTGATISGGNKLNTTGAGSVILRATITSGTATGTDYTKDFPIMVNAATTYTVIVNGSNASDSGAGSYAPGAAVTINAGTRSNYRFDDWMVNSGGVTLTSASSTTTTFTMPSNAVSVTANWTYTGGNGEGSSGGSSYTPPASNVTTEKQPDMPTVANVSVTGTVRDNILTTGIITEKMAKDAIAAAGSNTNGIDVQFNTTGSGDYVSLTATFERAALEALKTAGVTHVQIGSDIIDLTFDTKTITGILAQTTGNITVTATRQTNLSDATKALIGNRPIFDITIKDGNGVTVSDLKGGTATIGIPYKPNFTEKTGSLFGVYVDGSGNPALLTNSSYDNGRVIFGRSSLSVYGIGYKSPAPAFTDTTNHWAKDNIDFVASRNLISGTTATTFSPDTAITRADFLMALGRLSGADVSGYTTSSFTDVADTSPAMPYIEWAVQNKIVQGTGNNQFGPDRSISRQDMAVIMVNYAKATGYTLPVSRQAVIFADDAKISAYAKDAVKAIQQTGVISGKQNNLFDPQGNTTRAEASTILRRFVELVIDEGTARGWVQNDAGQWQYINTSGKAVTGLLDRSGNQYWFDDNGVMTAEKWVQISGKWYYFGTDGKLTASGITSPRTGN